MGVAWLSHQLFVCLSSERSWSSRTDGPNYSGCFVHARMNVCRMAGAAVSCSDSNWQGRLSTCPWLLPSSVAQKLQGVNESQKENESQRCLNYCHKQMRNYDMFAKVWIFPTVNSDSRNEKLRLGSALIKMDWRWVLERLSEPSLHCLTGGNGFCLELWCVFFFFFWNWSCRELCNGYLKNFFLLIDAC